MQSIQTYAQLKEIRSNLETLLSLADSNIKFGKSLAGSKLPGDIGAKLADCDTASRKKLIESELDKLSIFDVIEITTAFEPKPDMAEKIRDILMLTDCVIDFVIDESILGGVIINHDGKYKDLSLRKKIEKYK